jgi:hypothetical protein
MAGLLVTRRQKTRLLSSLLPSSCWYDCLLPNAINFGVQVYPHNLLQLLPCPAHEQC